MYILHALPESSVGGAGNSLLHLLEGNLREQHKMKVLLPEDSRLIPRLTALGIPVLPIPITPGCSLCLHDLPLLCRILRREHPDILHTHGYFGARVAGALVGLRTLVSTRRRRQVPRDPLLRTPLFFRFLYRGFTTHTVTTSEGEREYLIRHGIRESRISVIPECSPPLERLSRAERRRIRAALSIPEGAFVIGMVSRLETPKRIELLLLAARELALRHALFRVLILGDGSQEGFLRHLADRLGLADNVRFLGYHEQISDFCNLFDVIVNCSDPGESTPLTLTEAMSLGIPSIASDTEQNAAVISDGVNGLLFPTGDYTCLSAELDHLRLSVWERALLSLGAERYYRTRPGIPDMSHAYARLYSSLLRK